MIDLVVLRVRNSIQLHVSFLRFPTSTATDCPSFQDTSSVIKRVGLVNTRDGIRIRASSVRARANNGLPFHY